VLKEQVILYAFYTIYKLDVVTQLMKQGGYLSNQSQILHVTKQMNYIERLKKQCLYLKTLYFMLSFSDFVLRWLKKIEQRRKLSEGSLKIVTVSTP